MRSYTQEYEPYLRNGMLCLPEKTVSILVEAGLSNQVAESARRGLFIEDSGRIAEITESLMALLYAIEARGWSFQGWGDESVSTL